MNNLGSSYSEVGRRKEAVAPTEEAVEIRRELAKTNPAFLPDLASALNNLGEALMKLGERQKSIPLLTEAKTAVEASYGVYREAGYEQYEAYFQEKLHALNSLIAELQKKQ